MLSLSNLSKETTKGNWTGQVQNPKAREKLYFNCLVL